MSTALSCHDLTKTYGTGALAETALKQVNLVFETGVTYMLIGPSGSGKTTLLSILGCLLPPSHGRVEIDGTTVNFRSQSQLAYLRRSQIGFVFQHAQLLPFLSVNDNLKLVAENAGLSHKDCADRLADLLERLDIHRYTLRKPAQLSGGQQQRFAIARAVLHRPKIILADEPTAALDWEHARAAVLLLVQQAKRDDSLLIAATHDLRLASLFDRVIQIESGGVRTT